MLCTGSWGRRKYLPLLPTIWQILFGHNFPCYFEDVSVFSKGHSIMLRCVSAHKFSLNSFFVEISRKFFEEVLFSPVRLKASNMPTCFLFDSSFEFLEVCKHFIVLPPGKDPSVPREVVDKGDIVSTSSEYFPLSRFPHFEWITSRRPLLTFHSFGNGCRCLPNWQASHTPSISFSLNVGSPMATPFDRIALSLLRLMWPIRLCHNSMSDSAFRAFCEHGRFHLVRIENEHSALSSSVHDYSTLFFDETTALVESNLHPLLNNLADRDQILRDGRYMQDIFDVGLLTFFVGWNIADVPNRMRSVVSGFDIAESLRLS